MSRRGRTGAVLAVGILLLGGTAAAGLSLFQQQQAEGESIAGTTWDEYDAGRRAVRVHATLSDCQEISDATVIETPERVEITLVLTGDDSCAGESVEADRRVRLKSRLGDRLVYDGSCLAEGGSDSLCRAAARTDGP